jgi:hypothetical protein
VTLVSSSAPSAGEGLATVLCTVLALHATSPAVVSWVAKCAYALCVWQLQGDGPTAALSVNVKDSWCVVGALGQSLVASGIIYHGKQLMDPSSANATSDSEHKEVVSRVASEHINRCSAVEWSLRAAGMIACGSDPSLNSSQSNAPSVPSVNRYMMSEAGVCEAALSTLGMCVRQLKQYVNQSDSGPDALDALSITESCCWTVANMSFGSSEIAARFVAGDICELLSDTIEVLALVKEELLSLDSASVDAAVREACVAIRRMATMNWGCVGKAFASRSGVFKSIVTHLECCAGAVAGGSDHAAESVRLTRYIWYAISGLIAPTSTHAPVGSSSFEIFHQSYALRTSFALHSPFGLMSFSLKSNDHNDDAVAYLVTAAAAMACHGLDCASSMASAGLVPLLLNAIGRFASIEPIARAGAICLAAICATDSGKRWFASSPNGPEVLLSVLTQSGKQAIQPAAPDSAAHSSSSGAYSSAAAGESAYIQAPLAAPYAVGGVAIHSSSKMTNLRHTALAAVVAIVHSLLLPSGQHSDTSAVEDLGQADMGTVLGKFSTAGATRAVPKLLYANLQSAVNSLSAANMRRQYDNGSSTNAPDVAVSVDIRLCVWLCRAVGVLGGVGSVIELQGLPVSMRRILREFLMEGPINLSSAGEAARANCVKMGQVYPTTELFDAVLIVSKLSHGALFQASPSEGVQRIEELFAMCQSCSMALLALSSVSENLPRLRSSSIPILNGNKPSGSVNMIAIVVDQMKLARKEVLKVDELHSRATDRVFMRLYSSLATAVCGIICNVGSDPASHTAFVDTLGSLGLCELLCDAVSDFKMMLEPTGEGDTWRRDISTAAITPVLFAIILCARRNHANLSRLEATRICYNLLEINRVELATGGYFDGTILTASLLVCCAICDDSASMRLTLLDSGIAESLHGIFEKCNAITASPAPSSASHSSIASHLSSAACRLVASLLWGEHGAGITSGGQPTGGGNFHANLEPESDTVNASNALVGLKKKRSSMLFSKMGEASFDDDDKGDTTGARAAGRVALTALSTAGSLISGVTQSLYASLGAQSIEFSEAPSSPNLRENGVNRSSSRSTVSSEGQPIYTTHASGPLRDAGVCSDVIAVLRRCAGREDVCARDQALLAISGLALYDTACREELGKHHACGALLAENVQNKTPARVITVHHTLLAMGSLTSENNTTNMHELISSGNTDECVIFNFLLL